jgi:hypothetical protein
MKLLPKITLNKGKRRPTMLSFPLDSKQFGDIKSLAKQSGHRPTSPLHPFCSCCRGPRALSAAFIPDCVKALCHTGVGQGTETVVNLDIRKSWELLPSQLNLHFPTGSAGKGKERQTMQSAKKKPRSAVDDQVGDPITKIIDCVKRELDVQD